MIRLIIRHFVRITFNHRETETEEEGSLSPKPIVRVQ